MTILSFSLWFIARAAWIQDTPDKNKCFWVCLVGTILIQFLLFATVELIVNSNYEAYSTDLP